MAADAADEAPAGIPTDVVAAFEDIPAVLWAFEGPEHRVVAANRAARASMGFRPGIVGRPIREVAPELEGQQVFETLDEVWTRGEPVIGDERRILVDRDGDGRLEEDWYSYTFVPTHHADGSMRGMTVHIGRVTEDVLRRREAETSAAESERRRQAAQDVVLTLQRSMLPTGLPVLPRARLAARYVVAGQELAAGGDWFDAVPLADGRVAVAVGDVVGHGASASAAMGRLRAIGGNALEADRGVAGTLAELDRFAARERATRAATVCVAVLDPRTGELEVAAAAHPPPFVVTADGTARWIDVAAGPPLGTGAPATPTPTVDRLDPGDVLVLYTDGLVERPGHPLDEGLEALARTAVAAGHEHVEDDATVPTAQVDRIAALTVERMGWTGGGHADDATLLAVKRTAEPPEPFALEIPADPRGLRTLRRALDAWLDATGVGEDDALALTHAAGEAATNALEHAHPEPPADGVGARVAAALDDDGRVTVTVADSGTWRPAADDPGPRGRGLMMMRGLVDRVDVVTGPAGTTVTLAAPVRRDVLVGSYDDAVTGPGHGVAEDLATEQRGPDVLAVSGPLDTGTVERFRHRVLEVARGGARELTVDLHGVSVFSSAAVQTVHELRRDLPGLRLHAAGASVSGRVLALTGLDDLLDGAVLPSP
ncbi:serine phosphatase RsbU (regulator of sigma subunit) [Actinomycetospora succinea]|uniref:Serine phosphatase RsbU (Regulator of sigma subunit) n=1 Tax=Actinomycetospora succinea TaxID=663603 RepID=A0A4R6VJJ7_9PSEU|nr:SpoIIE family protein phosphatase [Actinomycetospora succinea]TDQ58689.1 serine phosphatase RsbU (regulator of sigma subunit) [Actinomycetospora succinea]